MTLAIFAAAGSALILTQSSLTAPIREALDHHISSYERSVFAPEFERRGKAALLLMRIAAKLTSCPMCAGFWLGLAWAASFGERGLALVALGFVSSFASALTVALWLALSEAHAALGLWRFLKTPEPSRSVLLTIRTAGTWPSEKELALRDAIENDLAKAGATHIDHDCGEGTIGIFMPKVEDVDRIASACAAAISERNLDDKATIKIISQK